MKFPSFPLSLLLVAAASAGEPVPDQNLPEHGLCAHRGARDTHPENTLAAFREAVRLGAQMIEIDVRLTRDGELVVIHDATVDRTTDGTGAVADLSLAEIRQLDAGRWKGPQFQGEQVPVLREVLAAMPENIWLNLDLKGEAELGRKVAQLVVKEDRLPQTLLACKEAACAAARGVVPDILICNMDRLDSAREYVQATLAMQADFIQFRERAFPELAGHLAALQARKVRRNYCCTASVDTLRALFAAGVEFPLVDNLGAAMKVAEELGIPSVQPRFRQRRQSGF